MSWAALDRELRELLPRLALPAELDAAQELAERLLNLGGQGGQLSRLQAGGLEPSCSEAEALREVLAMAAERLAALNDSMPDNVADWATERVVNAACQLISTCTHLCTEAGMLDMMQPFLPTAQLLLRCGAATQRFIAQQVQRGSTPDGLGIALGAQAWALDAWQLMVCGLSWCSISPCNLPLNSNAAAAAMASFCAPPEQLHRWLQHTLASLQLLEPPAWKPGTYHAQLRACLARLLGRVCAFPAFEAHFERLLQDEQLCGGLLQLLLPGVSAMAVGLQLPPERRPQECTWHNAAHMAAFVSGCLRRVPEAALPVGAEASKRLLAAAAQLLQHCPFPALPASEISVHAAFETTAFFIWQLEDAVLHVYPGILSPHQPATPAAPVAAPVVLPPRQAQLLMAVLPRLGEALAALAQSAGPSPQHSARMVTAAATLAALLCKAARLEVGGGRPAAVIAGLKDLSAWLRAAATVLQWLPAAVAIAGREPHQRPGHTSPMPPIEVASTALFLAIMVGLNGHAGVRLPDAAWSASSAAAAVQADCVSALWELHTAACRAVHSTLAGAIPRALIQEAVPSTVHLVRLFRLPMLIATSMYVRNVEAKMEPLPDVARCLSAMAVAHAEALLATLEACGDDTLDADWASQLLSGIAVAVYWAPPGLATDARLQAAVARCLNRVPQKAVLRCCSDNQLLGLCVHSSHLAAMLVSEGLLAAVAQAVQARPWDSQARQALLDISFVGSRLMAAEKDAVQLCPFAEQATATAAVIAELQQALPRSNSAGLARLVKFATSWLPAAHSVAVALLAWRRRPEAQPAAALELAQAAAARSCAYLRCADLGGEGGPAAGQGVGSQRCSACRAVWYCGTACSHADWRAGHRRVCRALGAARAAEKERRRQVAAPAAADDAAADELESSAVDPGEQE